MVYTSKIGRLFKLFDEYDMLDMYLTTIPLSFKNRVIKLNNFNNIFILSKEDIIVSKIGRYSQKDIEDISVMIVDSNIQLILKLIDEVTERTDISGIVLEEFNKHVIQFKEEFCV